MIRVQLKKMVVKVFSILWDKHHYRVVAILPAGEIEVMYFSRKDFMAAIVDGDDNENV